MQLHHELSFFVLLISSLLHASEIPTHMYQQRSVRSTPIIAFSGLSGCGKSTLTHLIAQELKAAEIHEPEEMEWPEVIQQRDKYGLATAMLAFRQLWAKLFIDASCIAATGKTVLIDTYFFKIFGEYLGKQGMEWLVPSDDPYTALLVQLNRLDQIYFPDADCVVLIDISLEDWIQFLHARGRNWDKFPGFVESYNYSKQYIEEATIQHCRNHGIKLIRFEHTFGNQYEQAQKCLALLKVHCIVE